MQATQAVPTVDLLRPFQLERSQLRGRFVRLGGTVDYVLQGARLPAARSPICWASSWSWPAPSPAA